MTGRLVEAVREARLVRRLGHVTHLAGLGIEASGPDVVIGEVCEIEARSGDSVLQAEVVGLRGGRVVLMPCGDMRGVGIGARVEASGHAARYPVGEALLGRVLDAFGRPLDGRPPPVSDSYRPLKASPLNPLSRPPVREVIETGVRAIDAFLTLGKGQRLGIFAGSGVGKSTLLGMIARNVTAQVNVIALIGERGREVRDFIDKHLGEQGLARSVVIVATSDQSAVARSRAAHAATAVAEYFRDAGQHVLLMMDSVTRFAMARREIGLAAGEPPTARGYTPSVFGELPELCERCGTGPSGGSITALYTVLVEGDDFNEPISDMLRATLDGHLVLARRLAHEGHFPAVDVLQSTSRLLADLASAEERRAVAAAVESMALHERNRQMIDIGAYKAGGNPQLDRAVELMPAITRFLRQEVGQRTPRAQAMQGLAQVLATKTAKP
jgi:flagellum-specific ATP synthase